MLWLTPLTIGCAVIAVLAVREVAIRVVHPGREFGPLTLAPPILDTVLGCIGAVAVFSGMVDSPASVRGYRRVSACVLVFSFIPDVWLATAHSMGGGWPEAIFLMVMHVVVWAICITLLPSLSMTRNSEGNDPNRPLSIL